MYSGLVAATMIHRRWRGVVADTHHALLIAGAAAGIAAVFQAPAAGVIFAIEVPFRGHLPANGCCRRSLAPAPAT